jgi:histidinol-phosphatase
MNPDWQARYAKAISAAEEAGRIARGYFPDYTAADFAHRVEWKADNSPVTVADREAEAHLRATLLRSFPDDGFLGEESGDQVGTSGYRWIIDPVDGTRCFVRGIPLWATLVGLEFRGEMIAGVAVEPVPGNTYRALRGDGAYRNDRRIRVSDVDRLDGAMLFYSNFTYFSQAGKRAELLRLIDATQRERGYGDYYGFVLVAQGSGDLMADYGVHAWDVAGLKVIVEEAGGRFTDWDGGHDITRTDAIASNGKLHEAARAILGGRA